MSKLKPNWVGQILQWVRCLAGTNISMRANQQAADIDGFVDFQIKLIDWQREIRNQKQTCPLCHK